MGNGSSSSPIVERMLQSVEPSVRWKVRANVLGEDRTSKPIRQLEQEILTSPRVQALLQKVDGTLAMDAPVYAKWQGAQWVLMTLADIGYPAGDSRLQPAPTR